MTGAGTACLAAAATAVVVLTAGSRVPATDDEAWFLQVVNRCRRGEVLYRDVFYGAGPLAVWVALAVVRVTRPQLLAMRALVVAYFVALLMAATWLLNETAVMPGWAPVALWIGAVAFAGPSWGVDNQYGQLAFLATVLSLAGVAAHADGGPWLAAVVAGAAAGAAVAAKQNLGLVATVAATAALVATGATVDALLRFGAGFVLALVACFAPVLRAGALADFGRRAVANKVTYLSSGWLTPLDGLRCVYPPGRPAGAFPAAARAVAASSFLVLPVLVLAVVVDAAVLLGGSSDDVRLAASIAMAAAVVALAGAFPRADLPHVQGLFPTALLAVLITWRAAVAGLDWSPPPAAGWAVGAVLAAWTAVALVVSLDTVHRVPAQGSGVDYELPHLRGVPVRRWGPGTGPRHGDALRTVTGGSVFLLRPDAAWWYLAAGLTNPTPYDYPYASVFGPDGQAQTIAAILRGDVRWVCLASPMEGRLAPVELQAFVQGSMEPVAETVAGVVYRLPVEAPA